MSYAKSLSMLISVKRQVSEISTTKVQIVVSTGTACSPIDITVKGSIPNAGVFSFSFFFSIRSFLFFSISSDRSELLYIAGRVLKRKAFHSVLVVVKTRIFP